LVFAVIFPTTRLPPCKSRKQSKNIDGLRRAGYRKSINPFTPKLK
jgi:hypothetical protein